ncbi:HDIG domain-containing protein [Candidatus Woesearchaeota archaeon]|nr:HDIG domain-containing protein [Candidatus Woesearchaeota archaeon]
MNIPSKEECLKLLVSNETPANVIEHCKAVCKVAEETVDKLISEGFNVNKDLVIAGALLHDIERHKKNHVQVGADLVKSLGFPEVAEVISKHSLYEIEEKEFLKTVEEKIVFYADKRVKGPEIVSLQERFEDLEKRYKENFDKELAFTKKLEEELLK